MQALVQALGEQPRVGRFAEAAVLVFDGAAQTGAEDDPPTAQVVKGRHLARDLLWPSPRDGCYQRAQLDLGGTGHRPGVERGDLTHVVVGHRS